MLTPRVTGSVLGTDVEVTDFDQTCESILTLVHLRKPAYVCFATAHMLVEATQNSAVARAYRNAAIIAPDGAPVAWCLRLKGNPQATCVSGPRTMPLLLDCASTAKLRVGFYGGRPETLALLQEKLMKQLPDLQIVWSCSPPFRPLSPNEQQLFLEQISAAGVQLLFVGLGSPKQECWMQEFSASLECVCLGVGAAFEFLSGEKVLPPVWVQKLGLTWLVRLCQEPRRLARRNLYSFVFAAKAVRELAIYHLSPAPPLQVGRTPASPTASQASRTFIDDTDFTVNETYTPWPAVATVADPSFVLGDSLAPPQVQDRNLVSTPPIQV